MYKIYQVPVFHPAAGRQRSRRGKLMTGIRSTFTAMHCSTHEVALARARAS